MIAVNSVERAVAENPLHGEVAQPNHQPKRLRSSAITGLGSYVPERVVTNHELETLVDTSDEWIFSRTGIRERHIAGEDESTADLAEKAARAALQDAGVTPDQVQLIIVATCTADASFPSTAALLQDRLQCTCAAFDLSAACSGFVYALVTAHQFIATGAADTILVVGAEAMSRVVDWTDRNTCVLFGDGAGAAVVQAAPIGAGLLGFDLGSDGSGGELLKVETCQAPGPANHIANHGPGGTGGTRRIVQNGREVYRFAVNVMGASAVRAVENAGLTSADIDVFVPHQANIRIIEAAAKRLGMPMEQVFVNVGKYGNTSAASIPIALCEAREQGAIREGDTVAMVGFGGGLTWASCVMKWAMQ
jgi:3-oxoacyl-[acyl-carrier-protein] synthase-3